MKIQKTAPLCSTTKEETSWKYWGQISISVGHPWLGNGSVQYSYVFQWILDWMTLHYALRIYLFIVIAYKLVLQLHFCIIMKRMLSGIFLVIICYVRLSRAHVLKFRSMGGKGKERMNRTREMENKKENNLQLFMMFGLIRMKDCSITLVLSLVW